MIRTKIETFRTEGGDLLYRGVCDVTGETVSAGVVVNAEIPEGPTRGFERVTLRWVETRVEDGTPAPGKHPTYTSRVEFEIVDRHRRPVAAVSTPVVVVVPERRAGYIAPPPPGSGV